MTNDLPINKDQQYLHTTGPYRSICIESTSIRKSIAAYHRELRRHQTIGPILRIHWGKLRRGRRSGESKGVHLKNENLPKRIKRDFIMVETRRHRRESRSSERTSILENGDKGTTARLQRNHSKHTSTSVTGHWFLVIGHVPVIGPWSLFISCHR